MNNRKANFNFVEGTKIPKLPKVTYTDMPNQKAKSWEERFDKLVSSWKEPEWVFERHETLIKFTSHLIKRMKSFIRETLAEERKALIEEIELKPYQYDSRNGATAENVGKYVNNVLASLKTKKK